MDSPRIRGFLADSGGFSLDSWILLGFVDSPWIRGFSLDSGGFSFDSWIPVDSELYFGVDSELMQVCVARISSCACDFLSSMALLGLL